MNLFANSAAATNTYCADQEQKDDSYEDCEHHPLFFCPLKKLGLCLHLRSLYDLNVFLNVISHFLIDLHDGRTNARNFFFLGRINLIILDEKSSCLGY